MVLSEAGWVERGEQGTGAVSRADEEFEGLVPPLARQVEQHGLKVGVQELNFVDVRLDGEPEALNPRVFPQRVVLGVQGWLLVTDWKVSLALPDGRRSVKAPYPILIELKEVVEGRRCKGQPDADKLVV